MKPELKSYRCATPMGLDLEQIAFGPASGECADPVIS